MVSSLSDFSIEDNTSERYRASIERDINQDLERSGYTFGEYRSPDTQFRSLSLNDMPSASRAMDEALRELQRVDEETSSVADSVELGRGHLNVSLSPKYFDSDVSQKITQRVSPPQRPTKLQNRSVSVNVPKSRDAAHYGLSERSFSDLNRAKPATDNHRYTAKDNSTEIPKSFKNSQDLFRSLGIDKDNYEQQKLPKQTRIKTGGNANNNRKSSTRSPAIVLPDITDITKLISGNGDSLYDLSGHKKIGSIPISGDDQAILDALRTMQGRMQQLESKNLSYKSKVSTLESNLREKNKSFESAKLKIKSLEQQLEVQLTAGDVNSEKIQRALEKERKNLIEKQNALRLKIEALEEEASIQKIKYATSEGDRIETMKSLSEALDEIAALKVAMAKFELQKSEENDRKKLSTKERILEEARSLQKFKSQTDQKPEIQSSRKTKNQNKKSQINENLESSDVSETEGDEEEDDDDDEDNDDESNVFRKKPLANEKQKKKNSVKSKKKTSKSRTPKTNLKKKEVRPKRREVSESEEEVFESEFTEESEDYHSSGSEEHYVKRRPRPTKTASRSTKAKHANSEDTSRFNSKMQWTKDKLSEHDSNTCPVCFQHRTKSNTSDGYSKYAASQPSRNQYFTAPIFKHEDGSTWEEDDTVRPSMHPEDSLVTIISQLKDVFYHLRTEYHDLTDKYNDLDPGYGIRKRKSIETRVRGLFEQLGIKADQIYALTDMLEFFDQKPTTGDKNMKNRQNQPVGQDNFYGSSNVNKPSWINI
ncbi:centrosome microtubule-binding domain of Cep57-domain-containing protein [Lipomyces japonicus]|uniref:centrosome microtubule-binding domain of Cep57-domain-containing protein n=1 Tax=Lipomyces japonicus TaxID=56871 RepID=UPI0034CED6D8